MSIIKQKIACIAGTPIDTDMGVEVLTKAGYIVEAYPVSCDPTKQTLFQISSMEEKEIKILEILNTIKEKNINKVFVYCNSLSSAVDFEKMAKLTSLKIVTPFVSYKKYANKYNNIAVIAANAVATSIIEKVFLNINNNLEIITIGMLPLVWSIERKEDSKEIVKKHNLAKMCEFFKSNKAEALFLACTHFPYIKSELEKITDITIVDPVNDMLEELEK